MGRNGKENGSSPIKLDLSSDACRLESVGTRPLDCPNNPWRHPENHRPRICQQCPGDPKIWRVATEPLPAIYLKTKQGLEVKFPPKS